MNSSSNGGSIFVDDAILTELLNHACQSFRLTGCISTWWVVYDIQAGLSHHSFLYAILIHLALVAERDWWWQVLALWPMTDSQSQRSKAKLYKPMQCIRRRRRLWCHAGVVWTVLGRTLGLTVTAASFHYAFSCCSLPRSAFMPCWRW